MNVRACVEGDLPRMMLIWNQVVEDGVAFPQLDPLTPETARAFFAAQSFAAVAEENGEVMVSTSSTPTTRGAAATSPTPATPWSAARGTGARARRWSGTV